MLCISVNLNLVNIKWMHEKFNDVEVDTDASPLVLKEKLYSLISVPPQRQKIIMPGGILGDSSYSGIKLRDVIQSVCLYVFRESL